MFCTNCGAKLEDNAAFCTNCGQSMDVTPDAAAMPVVPEVGEAPAASAENDAPVPMVPLQPIEGDAQAAEDSENLPAFTPLLDTTPPAPEKKDHRLLIAILAIVLVMVLATGALWAVGGFDNLLGTNAGTSDKVNKGDKDDEDDKDEGKDDEDKDDEGNADAGDDTDDSTTEPTTTTTTEATTTTAAPTTTTTATPTTAGTTTTTTTTAPATTTTTVDEGKDTIMTGSTTKATTKATTQATTKPVTIPTDSTKVPTANVDTFSVGDLRNGVYYNAWGNLLYRLEKGWVEGDASDYAAIEADGIYCGLSAKNTGARAAEKLNLYFVNVAGNGITPATYAEMLAHNIQRSYTNIDLNATIHVDPDFALTGKNWESITISVDDGALYRRLLVSRHENYLIVLDITGSDVKRLDSLQAKLYPID